MARTKTGTKRQRTRTPTERRQTTTPVWQRAWIDKRIYSMEDDLPPRFHSVVATVTRNGDEDRVVSECTCTCSLFEASHRIHKRRTCTHTEAAMKELKEEAYVYYGGNETIGISG